MDLDLKSKSVSGKEQSLNRGRLDRISERDPDLITEEKFEMNKMIQSSIQSAERTFKSNKYQEMSRVDAKKMVKSQVRPSEEHYWGEQY